MLRRILTLSLLLAAGPALAQDVSFYGKLDLGYSHVSGHNGASNPNAGPTDLVESGSLSGSRLGVKVNAPLTDGFKFVGQVEAGISVDTSPLTLVNRQAFGGVASDLGRLTLGRHVTAQYLLQADVDPFEIGTVGNMDTLVKRVSRVDNSVQYVSPTVLGFEASGLYTFNKAGAESVRNAKDTPGWMLGLRYKDGPVLLGGSFYQDRNHDTEVRTQVVNVGGTLELGPARLAGYASRQCTDDDLSDQVGLLGGVTLRLGPGSVRASYTHMHDRVHADSDAAKIAVGYVLNWTAKTDLYAVVAHIQNGKRASKVFDNTDTVASVSGVDGISIGIRHSF